MLLKIFIVLQFFVMCFSNAQEEEYSLKETAEWLRTAVQYHRQFNRVPRRVMRKNYVRIFFRECVLTVKNCWYSLLEGGRDMKEWIKSMCYAFVLMMHNFVWGPKTFRDRTFDSVREIVQRNQRWGMNASKKFLEICKKHDKDAGDVVVAKHSVVLMHWPFYAFCCFFTGKRVLYDPKKHFKIPEEAYMNYMAFVGGEIAKKISSDELFDTRWDLPSQLGNYLNERALLSNIDDMNRLIEVFSYDKIGQKKMPYKGDRFFIERCMYAYLNYLNEKTRDKDANMYLERRMILMKKCLQNFHLFSNEEKIINIDDISGAIPLQIIEEGQATVLSGISMIFDHPIWWLQ